MPSPVNVITVVSDTLRTDHIGANQRAGVKWTPSPLVSIPSSSREAAGAAATPSRLPSERGSRSEGQPWTRTPHIDRFAARALVFDQAYCGSFPTIPMRTDLLTGRYTFVSRGWTPLPPGQRPLPQLLGQAGYVTQLIADTGHLFRADFQNAFHGWDWLRGQEGDRVSVQREPVRYPCDPRKLRADRGTPLCEQQLRNQRHFRHEREWSVARACESACDWLEAHYRTEAPFYLHVDLFDPHEAWLAPTWYADLYDAGYEGERVISPDYAPCDYMTERELQHARALYAAEVTLVDRWVGRVFDKIEDLSLFQNTAVFLFSDHGFYIGEHGLAGKHGIKPYHTWPFYAEVSNIVCMAAVPDMNARQVGSRSSALVQPVDVVPTILELTGVPTPDGLALHGESFAPLLRERDATGPSRGIAVTSGALPVHPEEPVHSGITDGRWLLVEAGPARAPALLDAAAPARLTTAGAVRPPNLIEQHPEQAQRLHAAYLALLERAGTVSEKLDLRRDLHTGVPLPATAIVPPERSSGRP